MVKPWECNLALPVDNSTLPRLAGLIAANTPLSSDDIKEDSELVKDLGLSSLERVMLSAQIESEFGIRFASTDVADIITVGDLVKTVDRLAGA